MYKIILYVAYISLVNKSIAAGSEKNEYILWISSKIIKNYANYFKYCFMYRDYISEPRNWTFSVNFAYENTAHVKKFVRTVFVN